MTLKLHRLGVTAAVVLGASLLATTAFAQPLTPAQQQTPSQSSATANPSDTGPAPTNTELQHFAHAAMGIMKVEKAAQPQIEAAKNTADRTKLEKTAEQKIKTTIRSNHLSVKRYEQIAKVVQKNSKVRAKVLKMIKVPAKS